MFLTTIDIRNPKIVKWSYCKKQPYIIQNLQNVLVLYGYAYGINRVDGCVASLVRCSRTHGGLVPSSRPRQPQPRPYPRSIPAT